MLPAATALRQRIEWEAGGGLPRRPDLGLDSAALHARLTLPWREALTEKERRRGITYYGSGDRLQALGRRLLQGRPVSIHLIGGSITFAGKYAAQVMQWLNASLPHR